MAIVQALENAPMDSYLLKKSDIDNMQGLQKSHFLNKNAERINKSLGDATGLSGLGVHLIEVPPGKWSTEYHCHYHEDECTYVLAGTGIVTIDDQEFSIAAGDFIGYRKGGLPHTMFNSGNDHLVCLVIGERLAHDVGDYPNRGKRIYRHVGLPWNLVDMESIETPQGAGKK